MARYLESKCKLCRRDGVKLFLKGDRCYSDKCAIEKRNYPPGEHGHARFSRRSGYRLQLREKQKLRRMYILLERQFRGYYDRAVKMKGVTGTNLLKLLEARLDNMVFRMGFAPSRETARQLVLHKHFEVNGQRVDRPSFQLRPGDRVTVRERSRNLLVIEELMQSTTVFVSNRDAWADPWKRGKMESLAMLLEGALHAESLVGLKMNVPVSATGRISSLLPALKKPTVSPLADEGWVAYEVILDEKQVRDLIPKLKRAGAEGLVEYPLNKVIY